MIRLSREAANVFVHMMTEAQLARVMGRMKHTSAAFPDIREGIAQAVADELVAMMNYADKWPKNEYASYAEWAHRPDDPGLDEFPEPDVGHYPGWAITLIWLGSIAFCWGVLILGVSLVLR